MMDTQQIRDHRVPRPPASLRGREWRGSHPAGQFGILENSTRRRVRRTGMQLGGQTLGGEGGEGAIQGAW
eukprot:scaffold185033_cov43-Tisochrysis_lutea.AAC.1